MKLLPADWFWTALRFAVLFALVTAVLLTLLVVGWEAWENPGGVYGTAADRRWALLTETALSWLLPLLAALAPLGFCLRLAALAIGRWRSGTGAESGPDASDPAG